MKKIFLYFLLILITISLIICQNVLNRNYNYNEITEIEVIKKSDNHSVMLTLTHIFNNKEDNDYVHFTNYTLLYDGTVETVTHLSETGDTNQQSWIISDSSYSELCHYLDSEFLDGETDVNNKNDEWLLTYFDKKGNVIYTYKFSEESIQKVKRIIYFINQKNMKK